MHFHPACGFALVVQLYLLHHAKAGAYYGHQQLAQQNQPQPQLPHMPLGKEGIPQQQYLGKELPHLPYGNDMPMIPYYGNEQPQIPYPLANPNLGKGMNKVTNIIYIHKNSGLMFSCHLCHIANIQPFSLGHTVRKRDFKEVGAHLMYYSISTRSHNQFVPDLDTKAQQDVRISSTAVFVFALATCASFGCCLPSHDTMKPLKSSKSLNYLASFCQNKYNLGAVTCSWLTHTIIHILNNYISLKEIKS